MSAETRYRGPAILAHWLMAALILALLPLGFYMQGLPLSPAKLQLYAWHKWAGMTVLLLAVLRLAWRLTHRPPPPLPGPAWQLQIAALTHALLYLLLFAVPLAGWLMSSAKGFPVVWFGLLPLPDLVGRDEALGRLFQIAHQGLAWGMAVLVLLHLAAALKHHWVDRDGTLARMLPGPRP